MTSRTLILPVLVALAFTATGCGTRGEGAIASETRQTDGFSRVESTAGIRVSIDIGNASGLEVRAQGNILPLIVTEVSDDTLRIHSAKGYSTSEPVEVILSTPALERIVLSGGSRGTVDGLTSDAFDVQLSGGSVLTANGTTKTMSVGVSGGSIAELAGLTAATIAVEASGGSRAELMATDEVDGSANGGSHVTIAGGANSTVDANGGSQVEHR